MPDPNDPTTPARAPFLGRALAIALAALFGMVGLGIAWVWQRARVEQDWRDRVNNSSEPFQAPKKP